MCGEHQKRDNMTDVELVSRSLAEMASPDFRGLDDPYGVLALSERKRMAFLHNPFVDDKGMHCQAVGVKGNVAIGGEIHFPLYWRVRGGCMRVRYGSTTFVAKEHRKTALGLLISEFTNKVCSETITAGAGCSQMMLRMLRYWKEPIFLLSRMVMLFKSRAIMEMKLHGFVSRLVAGCVDLGLRLYWMAVRFWVHYKLKGYVFETRSDYDADTFRQVADLIAADKHPFSEVHDIRWLKWHLTESFTMDDPMTLTLVKRDGALIAFYMTKIRFHEQASARGFKNVRLGSIMEWQIRHEDEADLPWILLRASCDMRGKVDAVELAVPDTLLERFFRRCGWRHVGESNFTFHIHSEVLKKDADIFVKENWRLRPAMGDAGL